MDYYSIFSPLWREGKRPGAAKSTAAVLGIAQIFGQAVSFCPACTFAHGAQKSGQDIAVLPGWGEKIYFGDCCLGSCRSYPRSMFRKTEGVEKCLNRYKTANCIIDYIPVNTMFRPT